MAHLCGLAREPAGLVVVGNPHQAAGITEGKRSKEKSVDDAEHRRACAYAESDDENGKCSEPRVTPQGAERVAEVLQNAVEDRQLTCGLRVCMCHGSVLGRAAYNVVS